MHSKTSITVRRYVIAGLIGLAVLIVGQAVCSWQYAPTFLKTGLFYVELPGIILLFTLPYVHGYWGTVLAALITIVFSLAAWWLAAVFIVEGCRWVFHSFTEYRKFHNRLSLTLRIASVGTLIVVMLFPWESTVIPELQFQIIGVHGKPATKAHVRQIWRHFSLEDSHSIHQEEFLASADGRIVLPKRTIRASMCSRLFRPAINIYKLWGLAQFGPWGQIQAWADDGATAGFEFEPGKSLPSKLRLEQSIE